VLNLFLFHIDLTYPILKFLDILIFFIDVQLEGIDFRSMDLDAFLEVADLYGLVVDLLDVEIFVSLVFLHLR
jgi:hypothetical protein